ncbi:hypothetical protein GCM10009836_34160 [Pseudonocardia ailaonensis]|uniref:Leucine-binding protein domain-containing protein n=1 Tax=Pseudonocardia ailaonensis TaxID=367279 RepID=A0ABN2N4W2_9PSEU
MVAVIAVAGLLVAGCSSGQAATAGGAGVSGEPVKIGVIAPVNASISYPDVPAAAKAAARSLNAKGGINGRPIEIVYCNDRFEANQAAACARQLVGEGVVATAGNFTAVGQANVLGVFGAADIASVGVFDAGPAGTDAHSFVFQGSVPLNNAGQAKYAAQSAKRVALVFSEQQSATPGIALSQRIIESAGGTITSIVRTPNTGDLSPQASATVAGNPDAVILNGAQAAIGIVMKNMVQLGFKGKFFVGGTAIDEPFMKTLGPIAAQVNVSAAYPPASQAASIPGLKLMLDDMAAEKAAGDADAPTTTNFVRDPAMTAWLAVYAIAKVANDSKATDAKGIFAALNSAKDLDFGGAMAPWTPSKSVVSQLPRNSNPNRYFFEWGNGAPTLEPGQPTEVGTLLGKYLT